MESELFLSQKNVEIKLKTSLINNLKNSIQIDFLEGKVEISNLLNIGKSAFIKININKENFEYKLDSNLDIIQSFKNKILESIENNYEDHINFPLVNNFETLENIKILEKWRN